MKKIRISDDVYLDIITKKDIPRLQKLADHEILHKHIWDTFPYPYTLQDAEWRVNNVQEKLKKTKETNEIYMQYAIYIDGEYAWWIWRETKELWRRSHNFHLGYRLGEPYRGKWYMTKIVSFLVAYIFTKYTQCDRLYAFVYSFNPPSAHVLKKCWFRQEATYRKEIRRKGEKYDTWVFSILREDLP